MKNGRVTFVQIRRKMVRFKNRTVFEGEENLLIDGTCSMLEVN